MRRLSTLVADSIWKNLAWITTLFVLLGMWGEGTKHNVAQGAGPPLTIGFVYVGPKTDYGYNQAHAQGAAALAKLPGVKVREEEMVPETMAVQKTMESMINLDKASLLFPTSFGYFNEAQYVAGVVAGGTTKTNKLGFIAAKPIPQVLRNINSYALGAKSVN